MPYRFALEREDYSDLAAGKGFQSLPHNPAFPIRLANEIFQRCIAIRAQINSSSPEERLVLYDPCCGSGYLLGTLAYFNWPHLAQLIGSDIEPRALAVAAKNLALL